MLHYKYYYFCLGWGVEKGVVKILPTHLCRSCCLTYLIYTFTYYRLE